MLIDMNWLIKTVQVRCTGNWEQGQCVTSCVTPSVVIQLLSTVFEECTSFLGWWLISSLIHWQVDFHWWTLNSSCQILNGLDLWDWVTHMLTWLILLMTCCCLWFCLWFGCCLWLYYVFTNYASVVCKLACIHAHDFHRIRCYVPMSARIYLSGKCTALLNYCSFLSDIQKSNFQKLQRVHNSFGYTFS